MFLLRIYWSWINLLSLWLNVRQCLGNADYICFSVSRWNTREYRTSLLLHLYLLYWMGLRHINLIFKNLIFANWFFSLNEYLRQCSFRNETFPEYVCLHTILFIFTEWPEGWPLAPPLSWMASRPSQLASAALSETSQGQSPQVHWLFN